MMRKDNLPKHSRFEICVLATFSFAMSMPAKASFYSKDLASLPAIRQSKFASPARQFETPKTRD
jgi:hypothetical protein